MQILIRFKKLHPDAICPKPAHGYDEDAAADLRSIEHVNLKAGETRLVKTGLAVDIPSGYCMWVTPRSGLALKSNVTVLNAPGLVDPSYRGEICVILHNAGKDAYSVISGDRIAQVVIMPYVAVDWQDTEELSETVRSVNGFGSSGR